MPSPMAMQRPDSRIISLELHHQMAHATIICISLPQDVCVASGRIIKVARSAIPRPGALGQNEEIMSMKMHGMGGVWVRDKVGHVDADALGGAGVVDVPLGVVGVGEVAAVGFEEDGVAECKALC